MLEPVRAAMLTATTIAEVRAHVSRWHDTPAT